MVVVKVVDSQNQSASQQFTITIGSPVLVPSVVGQSMASAQTAIVGEGLSSGAIANATSATVLAGAVISQEPVAGSMVASGAAINLVVSSGPALVPVPYVIGKTAAAAAALLQNQGFSATIVRAFSNTVPDGVVMAQTPAAGTPQVPGPVSVTVSVGSGLALRLKRAVTTADASIPFTAVAYNLGYAETPAPPLTFAVTPALVPSVGALPTVGANAIAPALDTRGAFRVTATDAATGRTASAEFAVTYPRGSGSQRTMSDAIGSMNEAMADIDTLIRQGRRVLATNDTSAAHALLNQIVQRWKQVDIVELRFATPFGMPQGFFPSPADLPSLGLTPTAEDLLAEQVLTDALADLQAWIDGLRAPTTSMAQLRTLADQFNSRAGRLHALHLSEAGVIKSQALLTLLLCQRLPELYSALTDELAAVVASSGIPPGGANDFASGPSAVEAESLLAEELTVIALEYAVEKITDALNPIQKLREEGFEEAAWSVEVVLAAHHFRQYAQGLPLTAVVSGASQSFRAFEIDYAFIEGVFDTDHPTSNVVLTIGPDLLERLGLSTDVAFDDVKTAIGTAVNTVVNAAVMFRALTKVYDWMKGGSTSPSDLNNILEDSFQSRPAGFRGCIFTTVPECGQLVYEDGLRSVYETDTGFGIPVPILFIAYNKTTGQMYVDTPVFIPTKK
jgi:hypothetical protein